MADREVKLRFVVEDDGAIRVFDTAGNKLDELGGKADKASSKLSGVGKAGADAFGLMSAQAAGAAAGLALVAAGVSAIRDDVDSAKKLADNIALLNDASRDTGLSRSFVQSYRLEMQKGAVDAKAFSEGIETFAANATKGSRILDALGVSTKNLQAGTIAAAQALQVLPDSVEKTVAAQKLFGAEGLKIVDVLGRQGNAAESLAAVYDDRMVRAVDSYKRSEAELAAIRALSAEQIATGTLPALTELNKAQAEWNRSTANLDVQAHAAFWSTVAGGINLVVGSFHALQAGWDALPDFIKNRFAPIDEGALQTFAKDQYQHAQAKQPGSFTSISGGESSQNFSAPYYYDAYTPQVYDAEAKTQAMLDKLREAESAAHKTKTHIKEAHEHEHILKKNAEDVVKVFQDQNKYAIDLGESLSSSLKGAMSSLISRDGGFNIGDLLKSAGQKMAVDLGSGIIDGLSTGEAFTVKMPALFQRAAEQFGNAFEGVFGRVQSGAQNTAAVASSAIRNAGGLGYALSVVPNADSSIGGVTGLDPYDMRFSSLSGNATGLQNAASGITYTGAAAGPNYGGYAALAGSVLVGALGRNQSPYLQYGAQAGLLGAGISSGALGAEVLGVSAGAAGGALGAIGAGLLVANFAQSISGPGHVEFKPGTSSAIGAAGGAASGAAIGSIFPGIGTAIGAVVGAIAGALLSSFGTSGYTQEKLKALGLEDLFKDSGLLNAPGLVQTRSPGQSVQLDKDAHKVVDVWKNQPGDILFKLEGKTAPGDVLRQDGKFIVPWRSQSLNSLESSLTSFGNVFAPSVGGNAFAQGFLNTRQSFGMDRAEALTELDKLIAHLGITYKNSLDTINQLFIGGSLPQEKYLETIRDITTLVAHDLPPGVSASNVALSALEEHQGRMTVNVEKANQRLQEQVQIFQGLKDGIDSVAGTGIGSVLSGSTSSRSSVFTNTQSLLMQTVQNLALDDFKQTPMYAGLTQSLAALVRGDAKAGAGVRSGLDALLSFAGANSNVGGMINYTFLPESLGSLRDQFGLASSAARRSILSPNRQRGAILGDINGIDAQLAAILADGVVSDSESGSFTSLLGRKGSLATDLIGLGGRRNVALGAGILDQASQQATKGINLVEQQNTLLSSLNITMQTLISLVRSKGSLEDVLSAVRHQHHAPGVTTAQIRGIVMGRHVPAHPHR